MQFVGTVLLILTSPIACRSIVGIEDTTIASLDGGPDAQSDCTDDDLEPNDVIAAATPTGVSEMQSSFSLVGVTICPNEDVDVYEIVIDSSGLDLDARIEFDATRPLKMEALNAGGVAIRSSESDMDGMNSAAFSLLNLPVGTYFVRISTKAGASNSYEIELSVGVSSATGLVPRNRNNGG